MTRPLIPRQLQLERVPRPVVMITLVASLSSAIVGRTIGFPLWGIVLSALVPWAPVFLFEAAWKFEHYGFYTFLIAFVLLQIGHLGEHTTQLIQLYLSNGDLSVAHGVFGQLDLELVHFVWDSGVWLGVCFMLVKMGGRNKWLWIALVASSLHEVEHILLFYVDRFGGDFYALGGNTGILAKGGMVGSPFARPYLHYVYNFFVVVPLIVALWDETRRTYNLYLARALPSLTEDEKIAASGELVRVRFRRGEVIVRQGEPSSAFYVISKGEVEVVHDGDDGEQVVDTMGPGNFFGEMGLLSGEARAATVRALTEVELMVLDAEEFMSLLVGSRGAAADVESELLERLENLTRHEVTLKIHSTGPKERS